MKQCKKCKEFKTFDQFHKARSGKGGLRARCNICRNADNKQSRIRNNKQKPKKEIIKKFNTEAEYKRNYDYNKKYSITLEQYNTMFKEQNGSCAICKKPETMKHQNGVVRHLAVDHCHKTGKVRGLLCSAHNRGIGYFGDNIEMLEKAIEYLKK